MHITGSEQMNKDLAELETATPNGIAKDWSYHPGRGRTTAGKGAPLPGLYLVCRSADGFMETIGQVVNLRWRDPFGGEALVEYHDLSRAWHPIGAAFKACAHTDDRDHCRADYLIVSDEEPVNA